MSDKPYTLITGASSGLGEATALLLADSRNLILNGRNQERLEAVGKACRLKGSEVALFPFDLEHASEVGEALKTFLGEKKLAVDSFLHFAGMTEVLSMMHTKYSVGLKVMNVNYFSATEMISQLLKKRVNGQNLRCILLISSIAVDGGSKYQPHYCASKGAITSLGMALAIELAPRIRTNIIAPGGFNTRIIGSILTKGEENEWNPNTLLPPGDFDEVAKVARFLISDDAAYLTGQIIYVDGGLHFPRL